MKINKESTIRNTYSLLKHFQDKIIIDNLTKTIKSFGVSNVTSKALQDMGLLKKDIGFYSFHFKGNINEILAEVIDRVSEINSERRMGRIVLPLKYQNKLKYAKSKGYNGATPISSLACDLGGGDFRKGMRIIDKKINNNSLIK